MKKFRPHSLSIPNCKKELEEFKKLLDSKPNLKEREDVLPFFRKNKNLSAFISTYVPGIKNPDLIAYEYDIFGDFACDLAIGDSTSKNFFLIEFENANKKSLFTSTKKSTPEWAPRLEHGFSQVIDWFWKLNDMERSVEYENRFGARQVTFNGLVIIGRDQALETREIDRLKWRHDRVIVNSNRVSVITYDQLFRDLNNRLIDFYKAAEAL